jgi:peptidoglycan/LPS O-acetylase OafA/YrhL|mmetsp:Transcript_82954/g.130454  ORF Transcript_82954/g.130454 Transcript_82954/m.130454 type:complete len:599 (-) Transcript_82954:9-1805(-)
MLKVSYCNSRWWSIFCLLAAGIAISAHALEKKGDHVQLSEDWDRSSSAASISAFGQLGMLQNASPLVRRVRNATANDIDSISLRKKLATKFKVGDAVAALYTNGHWYRAKIVEVIGDDSYKLTWNDGDSSDAIKTAAELRKEDEAAEVSAVFGEKGTSFRLEFRSVVVSLLLLEASCLFLSTPLDLAQEEAAQPLIELQPLALQPIRFFGIVMVVLHHESATWHLSSSSSALWKLMKHCGAWGDSWVQFFLALSGFVLYLNQSGASKVPSTASFIWKRFISMYPAYLASILLGIAADKNPRKMFATYLDGHDLPGFLMIDSWAAPYLYAPNLPAWFLCSLFFCWLCFPRWYRFIRHLSSPGRAVLLTWLSTFAIPLVHTARWLNLTWDEPGGGSPPGAFAYWHPLTNWQPFVFGMCLARLTIGTQFGKFPQLVRKVSASVAFFTITAICLLEPLPPTMKFDPNAGAAVNAPSPLKMFWYKGPLLLPLFAVLMVFVSVGEDYLLRPSLLQNPWALWLGSVSAELYLFHYPVRLMVRRLYDEPSSLCIFSAQLAFAIAFNTFLKKLWCLGRHLCNEHKLDAGLRKLMERVGSLYATSTKT